MDTPPTARPPLGPGRHSPELLAVYDEVMDAVLEGIEAPVSNGMAQAIGVASRVSLRARGVLIAADPDGVHGAVAVDAGHPWAWPATVTVVCGGQGPLGLVFTFGPDTGGAS